MEHLRRPNEINAALAEAFKAVVNLAKTTPNIAMRIVFRKKDGSIRTMDVAYDKDMLNDVSGTRKAATEARRETNELHHNITVRERLRGEDGGYIFQWRTIPLCRIMSVSPMKF